jgi:hypothetical protein
MSSVWCRGIRHAAVLPLQAYPDLHQVLEQHESPAQLDRQAKPMAPRCNWKAGCFVGFHDLLLTGLI